MSVEVQNKLQNVKPQDKKVNLQENNKKPNENSNAQKPESKSIFDKMTDWTNKHEENLNNALKRLNDPDEVDKYGEEQIFEDYGKAEEEIGLSFDFMEGKDAKNEEEYNAQIHELAQGDFDKKDADGDGVVTFAEYIADEISSLNANDDEETIAEAEAYAYLMASIMDEKIGNSNKDGALSVEEFESFYKNLDAFNGEGFDEQGDGVITTDAFDMPSWLINNIFSEDTITKITELFKQKV